MVVALVAPIFVAYLIAELFKYFKESNDSTKRMLYGLAIGIVLISSIMSGYTYYNVTKSQATNYVPYYYTNQWQQAMDWVRDSTPTDSVFAHWWDYGYWVQTMGDRATITDGGNNVVYWNYLTGRYVLTGDNQEDSLEFLYTHNASHLLIDSSDIGKYGAFSQIGSDADYDRLSGGPIIMASDQRLLQETKYGIKRIYQGGNYLDEDISYNNTYIFKETGAIIGIQIEIYNGSYVQPQGIFYDRGRQLLLPLRYLYTNKTLIDFESGLNATAYPIQSLVAANNGLQIDTIGAAIYLSPRIMKGFLGQVYILDDPLNNFPAFKLEYTQTDYILQQIEGQGVQLDAFVYYQGIRGPIKIWNVTYPNGQNSNPKYLNTTFPTEIYWAF
jgi:hypothetical protein